MTNTGAKCLAMIAVSVLAVAACGSSGTDTSGTEAVRSDGDATTSTTSESTDADGSTDEAEDSPAVDDSEQPTTLEDYLGPGFLSFDPAADADYFVQQERRAQELIAQCMAEEGFEYVAVTRPTEQFEYGTPEDVDYALEYGFDVSTRYGETLTSPEDTWTDPNQSIVESLSESERGAYYETLYGSSFTTGTASSGGEGDESTEPLVAEPVFDGCSGQAYEEIYAFEAAQAVYEQLDLDSLIERADADPRVVALEVEWSECMAERGHDYEDTEAFFNAVYTDLQERFEEIVGPDGGFPNPFEGMSEDEINEMLTTLSQDELDDLFSQSEQQAQADVDQEALAALQDEERALAVDFAECIDGIYERTLEIYREYEAALVAENRALLEQFRESREG